MNDKRQWTIAAIPGDDEHTLMANIRRVQCPGCGHIDELRERLDELRERLDDLEKRLAWLPSLAQESTPRLSPIGGGGGRRA